MTVSWGPNAASLTCVRNSQDSGHSTRHLSRVRVSFAINIQYQKVAQVLLEYSSMSMSCGGIFWDWYHGTLSHLSGDCSSFEDYVPVVKYTGTRFSYHLQLQCLYWMIGWQVFSPRNGITGLGSIQIYHLTSRRDHIVDIKPSYLYNAIFSTVKTFLCSINGQGNAPLLKFGWIDQSWMVMVSSIPVANRSNFLRLKRIKRVDSPYLIESFYAESAPPAKTWQLYTYSVPNKVHIVLLWPYN